MPAKYPAVGMVSVVHLDHEVKLSGGNTTDVVRIGQTVHRNTGPWSKAVARLLNTLEEASVQGVPRHLGFDEQGREVLTFIDGAVAQYPLPNWLWDDQILVDAAKLMRRIHDASVGVAQQRELIWRLPVHEPREVVCHNDFAPYNLVFQNKQLTGVIDFDASSPGPRIWDLAYLAYRLVPFCEDDGAATPDDSQRLHRLGVLLRAYGEDSSYPNLLRVMSNRLLELADWTDMQAAASHNQALESDAAMYIRDADKVTGFAEALA